MKYLELAKQALAGVQSLEGPSKVEQVAGDDLNPSVPELRVNEPCTPTTPDLLAWASELAEQNLVLEKPVSFVEAPLRTLTTKHVSEKVTHYLRVISYARLQQRTGGMGRFKPPWWKEREEEALGALSALREAMEGQQEKEPES